MTNSTSFTILEIALIKFFLGHITERFGIREISRLTKTDYKLVHSTIQKLVKKSVVVKERKANLDLCSLNLKGDLTYIGFVEMLRKNDFLSKHKEFNTFFEDMLYKVKELYFTVAVFGSFAKGKEHRRSDLDLLIIAPTRSIAEEIQRIINSESLLLKRKVQSIILDEKEFVSNLADKKLNVVVEAFKNHIIITGVEPFYNGVKQVL